MAAPVVPMSSSASSGGATGAATWASSWLEAVGRAWRTASGNGASLMRDVRTWGHQLWSAQPRLMALAAVGTVGSAAILLTWAIHNRRASLAISKSHHSGTLSHRRKHLLDKDEEEEEPSIEHTEEVATTSPTPMTPASKVTELDDSRSTSPTATSPRTRPPVRSSCRARASPTSPRLAKSVLSASRVDRRRWISCCRARSRRCR